LKEEEWESIVKMSKETVTAKNEMDKASKAVKLLNDFEVVHNAVKN